MSNVWRFTGNPENWLTAISRSTWALNEHNRGLWENKIKPGDTVIFHSTANSDFKAKTKSSIIGFAYVGEELRKKEEYWWVQEVRDQKNYWPYVVPLEEIYLFSDTVSIDLSTPVDQKSDSQVVAEAKALTSNGLPLNALNNQAQKIDPMAPKFPVNGSASGVNKIYEDLILQGDREYYPTKTTEEDELSRHLSESIDERLAAMSIDDVRKQAEEYKAPDQSHRIVSGERKVRIESQAQKRRVAKLMDYTCQVCSFRFEYTKPNGKKGYIIEVDHKMDKAQGGDESLENLWTLCPNCHAKKTRGVLGQI